MRVDGIEGETYPGFCRAIWNRHIKEMSDLTSEERGVLMDAVFRVEAALRISLKPDKINLASLGNMTPHVHWHIIPRFKNDAAFPKPIWAVSPLPATINRNQAPSFNVDWIEDVKRAFMA